MELKLNDEGQAVVEDGKPVYVHDDGTEAAMDVAEMARSLSRANAEAAKHRTRAKEASERLKLFGDLEPSAAREAVAFRDALGEGIDPKSVTTQLATLEAEKAGLTTQVEELRAAQETASATIDRLTLESQITQSDFVSQRLTPALRDPGLFRAAYGNYLGRDDDGQVVVKDTAGNIIMSEKRPGEPATLDEALPRIVTNPHHLAAGNASGGGENGKDADAGGSAKKWSALSRTEQIAAIRKHGGLDEARTAHA